MNQTLAASVVDHYGQVVLTLNDATATLIASDEKSNLFGTISVSSVNGSFTFTGFALTATTETTVTFKVASSAVNSSKKVISRDNSTYSSSVAIRAVMCNRRKLFPELVCRVPFRQVQLRSWEEVSGL